MTIFTHVAASNFRNDHVVRHQMDPINVVVHDLGERLLRVQCDGDQEVIFVETLRCLEEESYVRNVFLSVGWTLPIKVNSIQFFFDTGGRVYRVRFIE